MSLHRPDWTAEKTLHANYRANKLLLDPNAGFGRNVTAEKLQSAEQRAEQGEKTFDDDDGGWCGTITDSKVHGLTLGDVQQRVAAHCVADLLSENLDVQ